ncbi:hypothetical protein KO465_01760 [Candidatus Micrarchaeota archaeon]|nr:hypothetical protein [Candidatus Micrarchaeota archaeon]
MVPWELLKQNKLNAYKKAFDAGLVDEKAIPLINEVNSKPNYVTTSSCSGRIMLLKFNKGKKDSSFYHKWHRTVDFNEVWKAIQDYDKSEKLWFRAEPFIFHIYAKDLESAQKFLEITRKSGIKRGGIFYFKEYPFLEIFGTEGISVPVVDQNEILIDEKYGRYVVESSNILLNRIFKRLDIFTENVSKL